MIHPSAVANPLDKSLHRSFLSGCFLTGTLGLFILPLHLALVGPPSEPVILLLAFMLAQWPLAHYLSRSGRLDRALGLSSGLFATFVAGFCALTGGLYSGGLIWMLVPIAETALFSSRRLTSAIIAFTSVLLAGLYILSSKLPAAPVMSPDLMMLSSIVALLYTGGVVLRIVADRKTVRQHCEAMGDMRRMMNLGTSEVTLELKANGAVQGLGGPIQRLLGGAELPRTADGLFERMHVADRPLYLTRLSEARHGGAASEFSVRMRIPGDDDGADHAPRFDRVLARLVPVPAETSAVQDRHNVVLTFQFAAGAPPESVPDVPKANHPKGLPGPLVQRLVQETRAPIEQVVALGDVLVRNSKTGDGAGAQRAGEQVAQLGHKALSVLDAFLNEADPDRVDKNTAPVDVGVDDIVDFCCRVVGPMAALKGISVSVKGQAIADLTSSRARALKRALCLVLHGALEAGEQDGRVRITRSSDGSSAAITVSLKNRTGLKGWTAPSAMQSLEPAQRLVERAGGTFETRAALGAGESVVICLPAADSAEQAMPVAVPAGPASILARSA